jgi:hypothetical protein
MNTKSHPFRTILIAIALIVMLGFFYFGIWPYIFGAKKMETFCEQITPGMQANEIFGLISDTDYKYVKNKGKNVDIILIIDSDASGRFICEVAMDGDKVVNASYVKND